jgi:hypothetical protein
MKVEKTIFVEDMLTDFPESNQFFLDKGLRCLKCGEPYWGSLEEFLEDYNVENIDEMIDELNNYIEKNHIEIKNRIKLKSL